MISSLVPALISAFKACRELALENVALRQQLAVLRRSVKRPRLSKVDRVFWVLLRRIWTDWEGVLVIVKPETVVRWHRCGFRRYWTWKSRRRRPGRPGVAPEIRELIRNMSRANPLWGVLKTSYMKTTKAFRLQEVRQSHTARVYGRDTPFAASHPIDEFGHPRPTA